MRSFFPDSLFAGVIVANRIYKIINRVYDYPAVQGDVVFFGNIPALESILSAYLHKRKQINLLNTVQCNGHQPGYLTPKQKSQPYKSLDPSIPEYLKPHYQQQITCLRQRILHNNLDSQEPLTIAKSKNPISRPPLKNDACPYTSYLIPTYPAIQVHMFIHNTS